MKIELDSISDHDYRVRGEVDAETLKRERTRLARRYAPLVNVKGFRPGHVPMELVIRQLGDALEAEARENCATKLIEDFLADRRMSAGFRSDIEYGETAPDGSFSFSMDFEAIAELDPKDYLGVEIPDLVAPPVTEEQIDSGIAVLRSQVAPLESRPADWLAHEGDEARCDIVIREPGSEAPPLEYKDLRLSVGLSDSPIEGIGRDLLGMKAGEQKTVTRHSESPPRDLEVSIQVHELLYRALPPLDDAFARRYGGCDTLAEWRALIRRKLEEKREKTLRLLREEAVLDAILEKNPVSVGPKTIERLAREAEYELKTRMFRGLSRERLDEINFEPLRPSMEALARRTAMHVLLLSAIAKRERVEVSDEEIATEIQRIAAEQDVEVADVLASLDQVRLEQLKDRLRRNKTMDMLVRYAVVRPADARKPDAQEPASAEPPRSEPPSPLPSDEVQS